MTTTGLMAAALAIAWLAPAGVSAHEGHEHVVMGVVQKVEGNSLDVKTRDEKTKEEKVLTVALTAKTEVFRGDRPAHAADIKAGERIVLRVMMSKDSAGKDVYTATRVNLAAEPAR